jgi:hypothetical protein
MQTTVWYEGKKVPRDMTQREIFWSRASLILWSLAGIIFTSACFVYGLDMHPLWVRIVFGMVVTPALVATIAFSFARSSAIAAWQRANMPSSHQ